MNTKKSWTIRELADELNITVRSIRYYEEKELVRPNERSTRERRVYGEKERRRLKLIARGKRFGMSLEEIAQILGATSADTTEEEESQRALLSIEKSLKDLQQRKNDIETMEKELLLYKGGIISNLIQIRSERP